MNVQRAARWSGSGICNGRLRLAASTPNARSYSLQAQKRTIRPTSGAKFSQNTLRTSSLQHTRSISIFGWGSFPPKQGEFATAHSPPQGIPSQVVTNTETAAPPSLEQLRSVKASHATSDLPDPSVSISTELPKTPEPAILKNLEDAIANPGGHSPEVASDISQIAEYSGYLKEACGLDYGWGTTTLMQHLLETLHISGGLTWAGSIVGMAVAYRALVAVFVYRSADQAAKMKEAMPLIQPIRDELAKATAAGDLMKRQQLAAEMQALNKDIGFSPLRLFLPVAIQIPFGFSSFRLLRGCGEAPVQAFLAESWLWNVDLSVGDPYYVVPLIQGALLYLSVQMSQKSGVQALSGTMGTFLMVGLPTISVLWSAFQPGSVQLFFLTSTFLAFIQGWALQKNFIRRMIGLLPMPENKGQGGASTIPGGMTRVSNSPAKGRVIDVQPAATPSSNRSTVDKVVDTVKSKVWNTTSEKYQTKVAEQQKRLDLQRSDKYEYRRRKETELERDVRNRANQSEDANTTMGPGGMRILKKSKAKKISR